MKSVRSIFSVLTVVIFLVPAAGLYYTRHSCKVSGEVQLVLDQDYSCCSENINDHHPVREVPNSSCYAEPEKKPLSHEETSEACCDNEGNYLKTDEKYTSPVKAEIPHIEIHITIASVLLQPIGTANRSLWENTHPPPLPLSSKDLLLQHGAMLI